MIRDAATRERFELPLVQHDRQGQRLTVGLLERLLLHQPSPALFGFEIELFQLNIERSGDSLCINGWHPERHREGGAHRKSKDAGAHDTGGSAIWLHGGGPGGLKTTGRALFPQFPCLLAGAQQGHFRLWVFGGGGHYEISGFKVGSSQSG